MNDKTKKTIYCCGCGKDVSARLVSGKKIYPHRSDLHELPFWFCDACKNYVGCHHKTKNPTQPLGCIPTKAIMEIRKQIHSHIDPLWMYGTMTRAEVYSMIGRLLGKTYHTGEIRSEEEGMKILAICQQLTANNSLVSMN